ncbi:MAG: GNAT family N-acetyltransferase [Ktedonobacterales bacterium]
MSHRSHDLPPDITIERATLADTDTFIAIYEEAARWLWDQGIHQWKPGEFRRKWILPHIERGEVYLAKRGAETLGSVLIQWSDEYIWGKTPDDAGYIHGLRVRRSEAGQGLGRAMLAWAEREIGRAGRPYARLDCIANNPKLCAYYQHAGYERRTDILPDDAETPLARFEKRLTDERWVGA